MSSFHLFAGSLIAIVVTTVIGASASKRPKLQAFMQGACILAIVLLVVAVCMGLWEAWSPWELTKK